MDTYDTILTFDDGNRGRIKDHDLGLKIGSNCTKSLLAIESVRVEKADYVTLTNRKSSRMVRKKLLDKEKEKEGNYVGGMI